MKTLATTRMSSRGQVVIPESIRKALGLRAGDHFVVVGRGDAVILKAVSTPDSSSFDELIRRARRDARSAGLTKADLKQAIRRARRRP